MIKIGLRTTADRNAAIMAVESRLEAMFCDLSAPADAVICDSVQGAGTALAAGKHVLLDAPESAGIAEMRALSNVASASGKVIVPAHPWRFVPSVAVAQSSLAAGNLGDFGLVRIHRWKATSEPDVLRSMLLADLDLVIWISGSLPETVYAVRRPDYLQLHLGWKGNGMAMIDHATARSSGTGYDSLTVVGSKGAAYADDHHNINLLFAGDCPTGLRVGQGSVSMIEMLKEFLGVIGENRQPKVTLVDTIQAMTVVNALTEMRSASAHFQLTEEGRYETR